MKFLVLLTTAALVLSAPKLFAQKLYFASINLDSHTSISGFLHSVTDSAVVIVPGHRKRDLATVGMIPPISIPIKAISRMVTWRVHGGGMIIVQAAAMSALFTSTTFFAMDKVGPQWGLPTSFMTNMALVIGYAHLANTRLSPQDVFFREKVEDRCIFKDDRSIVASAN
jgi:hypothetical protein